MRISGGAFEVIVLSAVAASAAILSFHLSSLFPDATYKVFDAWFGADPPRVVDDLTNIAGNHYRTKVHPIFTILFLPPTRLLMSFGLGPLTAAKLLVMVAASVSSVFLYLTFRSLQISRLDSVLLHLAFMSSASFLFWFGLIETFAFGAPTISFMIWIAAKKPRTWVWILGSAATLSVTTTNWSLGLLVSYCGLKRAKFFVATGVAFAFVGLLSLIQKMLMPSSNLFFLPNAVEEDLTWHVRYNITIIEAIRRILNFWLVSGAMPETGLSSSPATASFVTYGSSTLLSFTYLGTVAVISWAVMLATGFFAIFRCIHLRHVYLPVIGFLTFETLFYMLYGDSPFLWSAYYLPALMIICAFAFVNPGAKVSRVALCVFIISGAISNYSVLLNSIELLHRALAVLRTS